MPVSLRHIVRYPVKGLGPDYLTSTTVRPGGSISWDREYAIAHAETEFDASTPVYLEKHHFLMLMRDPPLAALKVGFHDSEGRADVSFPDGSKICCRLRDAQDRMQLERALGEYLGARSRGGAPRIVFASDHRFFDVPERYLSLINLESVEDLGGKLHCELDPIRFRANLYVSGLLPWQETGLLGRRFRCGDTVLEAVSAISRCAATSVNPETAQVDVNVPYALRKHFDTRNMGLYLSVIEGGVLTSGAQLDLI